MKIVRIGLDLAKIIFEVHGVDAQDKVILKKTLRRDAVTQFFADLPPCIVGMEACSGSHYWAKVFEELGHEVRLISPQFVTPYVKSNKNDRNDAEAICEAIGRPSMRFVPAKSAEQLEIQAVHRIRQRLVSDRTRLVNQIRGLLTEHSLVIARDISKIRCALSQIADGDHMLGAMLVELVRDVRKELIELDQRIAAYTKRIRNLFQVNEMCQRIGKIEGIGPITATALVAAVGDRTCFRNGRQFAAWLGLVPKQRSSGGKSRLIGISKRGDRYLRTLLIHGARAVLRKARGKTDARSLWIERMRDRRHPNVVAVALANKNARIVWAVLSGRTEYQPAFTD
ncbi:IS110 family transposase [uncultured Roseobacter sp.]|uniref:IS110 family transposase n=1 Tax=uncultured Roseobacter sp. TaxID=114847 RepID=UPI002639B92F|nr:IS110 family transposase [uncultured Roseobacter sp.]